MCVYLLKMREYFRWEKGFGLTERLPMAALGEWVIRREQLWERLEPTEFQCLPLNEGCSDPFDAGEVNRNLLPAGLVYSAGYGRFVKPHFFLGRLLRQETRNGFRILVSSDEYARDLSAPPAMLQNQTIYIRRESLRRMLWENVEDWRWRKQPDNAMARAVSYYGFGQDDEKALDQMTDLETSALTLHELGEAMAGELLGADWSTMMMALARSRVEIQARAVRDLLADCLVTLPDLVRAGAEASIHFFFANFRAMRRELYPRLLTAYREWTAQGHTEPLLEAAELGKDHWLDVARALLGMSQPADPEAMDAFIQSRRLS